MRALVKSRLGWALVLIATVCLIAVAAGRDSGPRTPDERIQAIAERVACPVCDGESVAESRNPTSAALLERIKIDVREGQMSDEEIIDSITSAREGQELLVPTATGIEALAWALPAAVVAVGVVGLGAAFARWRRESASVGSATDADYQLVAAALSRTHAEATDAEAPNPQDAPTSAGEPTEPVTSTEPASQVAETELIESGPDDR